MAFHPDRRTKISSTDPLERLDGEIKRRTDVVAIFPNDAAVTRLAGAILLGLDPTFVSPGAILLGLDPTFVSPGAISLGRAPIRSGRMTSGPSAAAT